MVQLLIMYYVVFAVHDPGKMITAIIAFGLNSAAYVAEIVRSVHHYPSLADVLPIVKKNSFNRDAYPRFRQHRSKKTLHSLT